MQETPAIEKYDIVTTIDISRFFECIQNNSDEKWKRIPAADPSIPPKPIPNSHNY
jgi:hypothetical protein